MYYAFVKFYILLPTYASIFVDFNTYSSEKGSMNSFVILGPAELAGPEVVGVHGPGGVDKGGEEVPGIDSTKLRFARKSFGQISNTDKVSSKNFR
jgi:hypothetical protein